MNVANSLVFIHGSIQTLIEEYIDSDFGSKKAQVAEMKLCQLLGLDWVDTDIVKGHEQKRGTYIMFTSSRVEIKYFYKDLR